MKWRRIKAFIIYDLKGFLREKSEIFWVIVWPIMLVLMAAYVFIPPSSGQPITLDIGVVNYDTSTTEFNGEKLVKILEQIEFNGTKVFNVKVYDNESKLLEDLRKGRLDVGLVVPDGFGANITMGTAKLKVYVSGRSIYSIQIHREFIEGFFYRLSREVSYRKIEISMQYIEKFIGNKTIPIDGQRIPLKDFVYRYLVGLAIPINVTIKEEVPETLAQRPSILGWYVLGAVGMTFLYTGFILGATAIVAEKERGSLERILSTPTTEVDMLVGKLLSGLTILLMSATIVILTGLAVGARIIWSPFNPMHWIAALCLALVGIMSISIGFLLSLVAKTTRAAGSLGTILGLVLAFTAGIWFPKEWMPPPLRGLAEVFPVTWGLDIVRNIMVFNLSFEEISTDLLKTVAAAVALFIVGVYAYRKTLRRYAEI